MRATAPNVKGVSVPETLNACPIGNIGLGHFEHARGVFFAFATTRWERRRRIRPPPLSGVEGADRPDLPSVALHRDMFIGICRTSAAICANDVTWPWPWLIGQENVTRHWVHADGRFPSRRGRSRAAPRRDGAMPHIWV